MKAHITNWNASTQGLLNVIVALYEKDKILSTDDVWRGGAGDYLIGNVEDIDPAWGVAYTHAGQVSEYLEVYDAGE